MSPARPQRLAWHRRLEARVVAGVGLLVACSIGAILIETTRAVTTRSLERASDDLEAARSAFYRLVDDRAEFAAAQTALVTALPVFRAHMTDSRLANDVATLEAMADEYRRQLKADFCIVTDAEGAWTARSGWPSSAKTAPAVVATIATATAGRPSRDIIGLQDRLFLVVSEPARFGDEVLGTLTIGYALDDAVAQRLAQVTHCDVNLVSDGRLYASSLVNSNRAALTTLVATEGWPQTGLSSGVQPVGAGSYVIGAFPLSRDGADNNAARLILLQDWRPTQQFVDQVQRRLLAAGAVTFVLALASGVLFSRRTSQPLQDLSDAAADIAAGNWSRRVPVRGSAEAIVMAQAFNEMTASLSHWYDEARKRDDALRQAQKLEAIGRLAGGVAHDFNNVLTAIKGYGELLRQALDSDDPRRADADEILNAADRAASLTRQLLAFSRRQVVRPRVLALDQVLAPIEQMLRRVIGEDIELSTAIEPALGRVRADPTQIEQVLLNLAVNARDAMPNGGTLRIELANVGLDRASIERLSPGLEPGRYVRLSVADTGCGMTQDTASRIFEPFFTTKDEGHGTGLGLATVHGIVEQCGGTIEVDTAPGLGTTFRVYLPETSDAADQAALKAPSTLDTTTARGSETVLLVEDDPAVAAFIASALRKADYNVLEASGSEQALDIVSAHAAPIHLLLTDVVMSGMNGRELSDRVTAKRGETRVLFMSGHSDDAILRRGIETASANFIQKPFSIDALATRIRQTLENPLPGGRCL